MSLLTLKDQTIKRAAFRSSVFSYLIKPNTQSHRLRAIHLTLNFAGVHQRDESHLLTATVFVSGFSLAGHLIYPGIGQDETAEIGPSQPTNRVQPRRLCF